MYQRYYLKVTLVAHLEDGTSSSQDHLENNIGTLVVCTEHSEQLWGGDQRREGTTYSQVCLCMTWPFVARQGDEISRRTTVPGAEENIPLSHFRNVTRYCQTQDKWQQVAVSRTVRVDSSVQRSHWI